MTPSETERRLRLLEGAALARRPDPLATEFERWAATVLCRAMAHEPDDQPMGAFGRALLECACLDVDHGDADPVRRSYFSSQPHDPSDPAMAELQAQVEQWITDPKRRYMGGADVRGWLAWHGVDVDALSSGELTRLVALLKVFKEYPIDAATLQTEAIWSVVGEHGQRRRHEMARCRS